MIDLLLTHAAVPADDEALVAALAVHTDAVLASTGRANRSVVERAEALVGDEPTERIRFDESGHATVRACGREWSAGRFEAPTLADLRERAIASTSAGMAGSRCRLWVLDGEGPATDIGALQATAPEGVLFQVASQFNALESTGPRVVPVTRYLRDPTQGPRAAVSAFPAALVRHYAAPSRSGGRFTQSTDGEQVELLGDVLTDGVARVESGYLRTSTITDDSALATLLRDRFEHIRVGVQDDVEVALGYDWDGGVEGDRRIAQVFTSTLAGGAYSDRSIATGPLAEACRQLQRAAYLGTLLSAVALGRRAAVLTLIGGGVFGNPVPLIWESMLWALDELDRCAPWPLDVVVNGRTLARSIPRDEVVQATRDRGGAYIELGRSRETDRPTAPVVVR